MISWIQTQKWQASALISVFSLLFFGGIDLFLFGLQGAWISAILAVAVLFAATIPWLSLALVSAGLIAGMVFEIAPGPSAFIALVALFLASAFASRVQRNTAFITSALLGLATAVYVVLISGDLLGKYGLFSISETARNWLMFAAAVLVVSLNTLAWLLGRLLATRSRHVGTSFDRAVAERTQAKLALEVAEQNERFEIARDISELVIQRVSATISIAEGGLYAVQSEPAAATRVLQQKNHQRQLSEVRQCVRTPTLQLLPQESSAYKLQHDLLPGCLTQ